jgi:predicted DNA repair protein MutK
MSGLIALLDDVAALAKLAAAQLDDVGAMAAKAGSKSLGVVIDDTAVTPTYVQSLPAARELPIIWKIARGSLFNKLVILLPAALLIDYFAPWLMTPLLMIGGLYLCYEGAEKILHLLVPHSDDHHQPETLDAAHLEEQRVAGAIKTDFILSAEIMTIAMTSIEASGTLTRAVVLAIVAVGITAAVYGSVALLVKMDDVGLVMSQKGRLSATRAFGRGMVKAMPYLMSFISAVGTAAMLWVGGQIVLHGLPAITFLPQLADLTHWVEHTAEVLGHAVPSASGFVEWLVGAGLSGVFGLALGFLVIPVAKYLINPLIDAVMGLFGRSKPEASGH